MRRHNTRRDHKWGMIMAGLVVALLTVIVAAKGLELKTKLAEQQAKEEILTEQLQEENERTEEIIEYEKYTKTRKFIEETAREKLGLIYDGEIIFRNSDSN